MFPAKESLLEIRPAGLASIPKKAEGGIAFAWIRTSQEAGKIRIEATAEGGIKGETEITTLPYNGEYLPSGKHKVFIGHEEDNVVIKPSSWQQRILKKTCLEIKDIQTDGAQKGYPSAHIIDKNDRTWWIAPNDKFPKRLLWIWERQLM